MVFFIPSGGGYGGGPDLSGRELAAIFLGMVVGLFFGGITAVWIGNAMLGNQDIIDVNLLGLGRATGLFLIMAGAFWALFWTSVCALGFHRLIK